MPERDIESLGVMGWARKFFRRRRRRPLGAPGPAWGWALGPNGLSAQIS